MTARLHASVTAHHHAVVAASAVPARLRSVDATTVASVGGKMSVSRTTAANDAESVIVNASVREMGVGNAEHVTGITVVNADAGALATAPYYEHTLSFGFCLTGIVPRGHRQLG